MLNLLKLPPRFSCLGGGTNWHSECANALLAGRVRGGRAYTATTLCSLATDRVQCGHREFGGAHENDAERQSRLHLLGHTTLGCFGEFFDDAVALELGKMIDKEHAIDVVNLVLQAGRQETLGINLVLLAAQIEEFDLDLGRPLDFLVIIRNRQTSFLKLGAFVRLPGDFRINEHLRLVIVLFF